MTQTCAGTFRTSFRRQSFSASKPNRFRRPLATLDFVLFSPEPSQAHFRIKAVSALTAGRGRSYIRRQIQLTVGDPWVSTVAV